MTNKKLLMGTVAMAALGLFEQAYGLSISGVAIGGSTTFGTGTYYVASEATLGTASPTGSLAFQLNATTGTLPSGNVVLTISMTNAVFASAVNGTIATGLGSCSAATSTLSSGGAAGSGTVTLILTGLNSCATGTGGAVGIAIPSILYQGGAVSLSAGLGTTDTPSLPVDGGTATRASLIAQTPGFVAKITPAAGSHVLSLISGFKSLTTASPVSTSTLGTIALTTATGAGVSSTVYQDLAGNVVNASSYVSGTVTVTGDFTNFGIGTGLASLTIGGVAATIGAGTAAVTTATGVAAFFSSASVVYNTGTVALNASNYSAAFSGTLSTATGTGFGGFASGTTKSGSIDAVSREGTSIIFPWAASNTRAAASGSINQIRIANRTSSPITGVFASVINSSSTTYTTFGTLVPLPVTIPANGEVILQSSDLQNALGDFQRGDVQITVQAPSTSVTMRRLVSRPDGTFEFDNSLGAVQQGVAGAPS